MKYWLLNVFSLSLSIDLDWGRVMKLLVSEVENIALFEEENDTVTRQDPSLLDMASYQEQIQKLAPRLYDLLTALVLLPIRYGRSRTGEKNGSKVLHIMSMILKQRSQRAWNDKTKLPFTLTIFVAQLWQSESRRAFHTGSNIPMLPVSQI